MQETWEMQVRSLSLEDPWRRKWQHPPVFLPGDSHGQRSLAGSSPWSHKELNMTGAAEHIRTKVDRRSHGVTWSRLLRTLFEGMGHLSVGGREELTACHQVTPRDWQGAPCRQTWVLCAQRLGPARWLPAVEFGEGTSKSLTVWAKPPTSLNNQPPRPLRSRHPGPVPARPQGSLSLVSPAEAQV